MPNAAPDEVRLRLYCQGIGDCILVDMPKTDGGRFHLLVDCGVHMMTSDGPAKMADVVADLKLRTGGTIDAIAGTHEHWDHLSAFLTAADAWRDFTVGAVWLSWAEDPADPIAQQLDRFKGDATAVVSGLRTRMGLAFGVEPAACEAVDGLMGFVFGAAGERVRDAREALRALGPAGGTPLEAGTLASMPGVEAVRAYVLGPPKDAKALKLHDNPPDEYRLGMAPGKAFAAMAGALAVADERQRAADDQAAPFDGDEGQPLSALLARTWDGLELDSKSLLWNHYFDASDQQHRNHDPIAARRRIDGDWLGSALDFALQLDRNTNNSSLVLALEFVATGHVLLLAADAQGGNWKSWETVTFARPGGGDPLPAAELVARTLFYKVGHHGSVNATSVSALESMDRKNLVAFIPVDADVARTKCRWKDFPAQKLTTRLAQLSQNRVISADSDWLHDQTMPVPLVVPSGGPLLSVMPGMAGSVPWVELTYRCPRPQP